MLYKSSHHMKRWISTHVVSFIRKAHTNQTQTKLSKKKQKEEKKTKAISKKKRTFHRSMPPPVFSHPSSASLANNVVLSLLALASVTGPHTTWAFHDCIQPHSRVYGSEEGRRRFQPWRTGTDGGIDQTTTTGATTTTAAKPCGGGLCVGMHDGPHEGGPAA